MRILGLDPGTATTGYGIIDVYDGEMSVVTWGVIKTTPDDEMAERLLQIHTALRALLAKYQPDTAGVEELFFGRNATTAITVGQARGVELRITRFGALHVGVAEGDEVAIDRLIEARVERVDDEAVCGVRAAVQHGREGSE